MRNVPLGARGCGPALFIAAALLALLAGPAALKAELFAGRIDAETRSARRVGGPDAIAGIGDWALANGTLCAAIADPSHETVLSAQGGVLVDLGHCGADDDQWVVLQPMLNLSRDNSLPVQHIEAQISKNESAIVTRGILQGIRIETRYSLDLERVDRLRVVTRLERVEEGDSAFLYGDVVLHGHRQLSAFTLSTTEPSLSVGFDHPAVDVDSPLAMAQAMVRADLQVLIGGSQLEPGIAYGWRLVEAQIERVGGVRETLPHLALNGEHFSIIGSFVDTLWIGGTGSPGLMELAQTLLLDLDVGERVLYEREVIVGRRADAASVTDHVFGRGPRVKGRVDDPTARLHVHRADGAPITFVRPGADGGFDFRLPPGEAAHYVVEAVASGGRATREISTAEPQIDVGTLSVRPPARLALPAHQRMRLVFKGAPPTPDPRFRHDHYDFHVGEKRVRSSTESNSISLLGGATRPPPLALAPGRYRVYATRGPEWSVSEQEIEMVSGRARVLKIAPPVRVLESPGWISADLHVHSALSDDSSLPLDSRLRDFAVQGADVIVSTEHDRVVDYAPAIQALGLAAEIASVVGVEATSTVKSGIAPFTIGHSNAFPLAPQPDRYRGGAPRGENVRLRDLASELSGRARTGRDVVRPILQLNHPREGGFDGGLGVYFEHLGVVGEPLDPTRPLSEWPNSALVEPDPTSGLRDIDFDALELLNGPSMRRYRLTRADWFSLLLQGEVRTATANSDSHSAHEIVALPRNYLAYAGPRGAALDRNAFVRAVRAGRLYGSTGPLLDVRLGDRGPGQRFEGRRGELSISVRAADWVPLGEVRIYVDGALYERVELRQERHVSIPLQFVADAFVTVEVEGEPGPVYAALAPGFTPFAFSNPIFVDHDRNGSWSPPGLPSPLPPTLSTPLESP